MRRQRTAAEYRESLARILEVSEGTTNLIESLLTLARADGGSLNLKLEAIDLTEAIAKMTAQVSVLAASKGLSFFPILPSGSLRVRGDAAAIEKLLLILLDNAVKYTPEGGSVWLRLHESNGDMEVEAEDAGIGIAPEDQARILDRLYRANQSRSATIPGAGLVPSIASWIAAQHRSAIEVESKLNSGSIFRLRLPLMGTNASGTGEPLREFPAPVPS